MRFTVPVNSNPQKHHTYYATVVAVFCALLLISNIGAVKLIQIGPLVFDGGAILFPMTYIIDDILARFSASSQSSSSRIT